ncbi:retrovirus-related pol polyprotein from transposon TNT 1-94 [Tanacetum coccineum]
MATVEVPQTFEYMGGQLNAALVLEVENFTNWKKRFMCHILGIEPQFENIIKNGHFILMTAGQRKPEKQWTAYERKASNLDQRLKSLIMSVLPDDQMNSVINCLIAKSTWDDLILYHEGPSNVKESKVIDLKLCYNTFKFKDGETLTQTFTRYKALMNELANDGIKLSKLEINIGFINRLPKKWLSFCQSLRNTNHVKDSELASLFGKLKYEENLIDNIYETEKNKSLISVTPLSNAFISTFIVPDFQDSPDDEEDTRSSIIKAKLALLSSSASASKVVTVKNKGLIAEAYEWDEEEVSSDDNEMVEVKHINTEILKENKNLRTELKEITSITETWLNSSNKVNQCISEQIPSQKKRILRVDQLIEDPSSSGQKDLVFVKSSADDTKVSIPGVERPWLSEAEGFIFPNHDTGRILPAMSQRNTTDPSVVVTDSSATKYDSVDESLVCSNPLHPLKKIISLEREINPRNPQHAFKRCEACGSLTHTTTDHYDIEWFKRGEALQAKKAEALKSTRTESSNAIRSKTPTRSGYSRHMTGVKSYLHKYEEQPGPKVVFGDDSTCVTEGYGSIKCNGIVFTKKRGIIFNSNKEIVMIAPRVKDVYVFDMTSSAYESCFFAKASKNINWLWHKRLAHLNFKIINKLAKQNLVIGLPLLVYSKDKPCSSCEKGKNHKASFKTKPTSSIKKCLHLLHMDLFGLVTPRSINHEKYTLVIVDEYSRVFNTRRQQTKETYHITFDESLDDIKLSNPLVNNINIDENKRYPPDEYLHP